MGEIDAMEALAKQVEVAGDLEPILERARFREFIQRVLAKVPTSFR